MRDTVLDSVVAQTVALLSHYGFDMRGYSPEELVTQWLMLYHPHWIRLAVIEALYQGRYKAISVEQILTFWARRQHPTFHFNHEFERLICRKLPRHLTTISYSSWEGNKDSSFEETSRLEKETVSTSLATTNEVEEETNLTAKFEQDENLSESVNPATKLVSSATLEPDPWDTSEATLPEWERALAPSSRVESYQEPIHQFTPPADVSDFYLKLKAVVKEDLKRKAQG